MIALSAQNVSFSYGERRILSDVSIEVHEGEVVGLLGPNGTGKSTLLGVLAGDLEAHGEVLVYGKPVGEYSRKELARMRSVMQQTNVFPFAYLSRDIVNMGRTCWDTSEQENDAIVEEAMLRAEVSDFADRVVTHLSGGESSRVTFARVLAQCAKIVFLDEPTAALDIAHQERALELCNELVSDKSRAVVAVMHDIQVAAAHCDRIALMSAGRIVALGAPVEVLTSERLSQVYGWPIQVRVLDGGEVVVVPSRRRRKQFGGE